MSRRLLPYLALAAAVLCLAGFATTLKPFTNRAGNFRILMPGTPIERTSAEDTPAGPVELYQASLVRESRAYFVGYSVLPDVVHGSDPAKLLASARDGAAARVHGEVVADRALRLADRYPGREFTIRVGGRVELTQRVYLVEDRLYQVNLGCAAGACTRSEVQAFLDSFRLLALPD